jgi:hypothetical protein
MFSGEYFFFCPSASFSFLSAELRKLFLFFLGKPFLLSFNFVQQEASRQMAVQTLGSFPLAFHGKAGRKVGQLNAGGSFVDFLSSGAGGSDKGFFDVSFGNAKLLHAQRKRFFFFRGNRHKRLLTTQGME